MEENLQPKVDALNSKIESANNILIIASTPVDHDSLATALTLKWYIKEKYNKESNIYIFANILDSAKSFPGFEDNIQQKHPDKVDFSNYDLVILEDGNALRQFFTSKYEQYLPLIKKENLYSIDHHEAGPIGEYIPENTIRIKDSCTSKIVYDYFVKPSGLKLNLEVATWLYMSLSSDTGIFNFEVYKDTFAYAQMLLDLGVDHYKAVEFSVPKEMMNFTVWAIEHTVYYEVAGCTILSIDQHSREQLTERFSKDWENKDLLKYYQKIFMHMVEDYPYGLIFKEGKDDGKTRVVWRCSALSKLELMPILRKVGFVANGHRNAGGGITDKPISQAVADFIKEMEVSLNSNSESNSLYTNL
jgi:nanoRNase/pAp phosphatase (c-di-AMP/oligoRNAs hydrolase)